MPYSHEHDRHKTHNVGGTADGEAGKAGTARERVELPPGAGGLDGPLRAPHAPETPLTHVESEPVTPGVTPGPARPVHGDDRPAPDKLR
jgi:hypothetical protein